MPSLPKPLLWTLLACSTACGGPVAIDPPHPEICRESTETDSVFLIQRAESLAGRFRLVLVDVVRGGWDTVRVRRGTLDLWPSDSNRLVDMDWGRRGVASIRPRFPLGGAIHFDGADSALENWVGTVDRRRPRVELHANSLQMGDVGMTDGSGWFLSILAYSPEVFRGRWSYATGFAIAIDSLGRELPNGGGYFCAIRSNAPPAGNVER